MKFQKVSLFVLIGLMLLLPLIVKSQHSGMANIDELVSNLPIVIINTYGQEIPDEPKITAEMGIIWNGEGEMNSQYDPFNDYDGMVGIEVRGQSSQYFYPKKSYSFETRDEEGENLNAPILGMPEENDWVLYAPYGDKSMLRNMVTFAMARSMGFYCTRTVFCEVILNGQYDGVYVMMEKIKKDENRVSIATLKPDEISGDDLTGGYIIRVDKTDNGFNIETDGWMSYPNPPYPNAKNIIYQYYYPKAEDIVPQQKTYIQNYILDTENSLTKSTFQDPEVGYNGYLNTGSFVDQMLINEISKEVDKYRYSTYFFKEKDSDGGKLFAGPPWDFNLGYANVDYWQPGIETSGWAYAFVEPYEWSMMFWWKRLMEDSYFRSLAKRRWLDLRLNQLNNNRLEFIIDSLTGLIDDAQGRNYERWPILGTYVWPNYNWQNNTYEDEVEFFEDWFFERLQWIDYNLPGIPLSPSAELIPTGSNGVFEIKLYDDFFSRTYLKNKYFTVNNAPPGIEIDTVIYIDATKVNIYLAEELKSTVEISVTLDAKILNTWDDLTTNTAIIGVSSNENEFDNISIFAVSNSIYLECERPELLGNECMIFNLSGQLVKSVKINHDMSTIIDLNSPAGIYICSFNYFGKRFSRRVLITD